MNISNTNEYVIEPNTTEIASLQLGNINTYAQYKLYMKGLSGLLFEHEMPLQMERKNTSIFIQMDRPKYKPNDVIKFRALFMDSKLKPIKLAKENHLAVTIQVSEF